MSAEYPHDIRLIALDLDGTTLDDSKHVPEKNREALRAAADRGVRIVLASGRMTDCITPFARELGVDCIIAAYNGAMARGPEAEGRPVLFHRPLEADYGSRLIEFCRDRYLLNYYIDDVLYAQDRPEMKKYAGIYSSRTRAVYHFVDDLAPFVERDPTKAIIIVDHPERERLHDQWQELMGDDTMIVKTDPEYLEFLERGTNKGVALANIARSLGIPIEQTMAIGDGDNDAQMLATAGLGLAVANATPMACEHASARLDERYDQCAVAAAVVKYVLD